MAGAGSPAATGCGVIGAATVPKARHDRSFAPRHNRTLTTAGLGRLAAPGTVHRYEEDTKTQGRPQLCNSTPLSLAGTGLHRLTLKRQGGSSKRQQPHWP